VVFIHHLFLTHK